VIVPVGELAIQLKFVQASNALEAVTSVDILAKETVLKLGMKFHFLSDL
jgi:hypothetical protein